MTAEKAARFVPVWVVLPAIFVAVVAAHAALLRLPYYWDEAGYYIPAAYDFFRTGSLIPYSTLSNAHPPLPSVYLAVWWKVFHFAPVVTRTAMCVVAAVALTAVWRLAVITTGKQSVAAATVLLTGTYPVFFAQSSLAHADLFAAAGTLWALAFFLEERVWAAAICFSLAAFSKETAIVTPLFSLIRMAEVFVYPPIQKLTGFPSYKGSDWVRVSRHKFSGLVGHDMIWCLYCDWMTGVWSLGSEMLRNVESFWCPIRFDSSKKCENCSVDFPDVKGGWVAADGNMTEVIQLIEETQGGEHHAWFGHPVRITVKGIEVG